MIQEEISLAELIATIRAELSEAAQWQVEREQNAEEQQRELSVPPLRVKELTIELEVVAERSKAGSAGIKFWVLTGALDGKATNKRSQKIVLTLETTKELHLGDADEPEHLK